MKKDKQYLYNMYNATSSENENGELETYEEWLERQLISRIEHIEGVRNWFLKEHPEALNFFTAAQRATPSNIGGKMNRDNFYCMLMSGRQNYNKCHVKLYQCTYCARVVQKRQEETLRIMNEPK